MRYRGELVGVVGLFHLASGIAGVAIGGAAAAAGSWLIIVGFLLIVAAWREIGRKHEG